MFVKGIKTLTSVISWANSVHTAFCRTLYCIHVIKIVPESVYVINNQINNQTVCYCEEFLRNKYDGSLCFKTDAFVEGRKGRATFN